MFFQRSRTGGIAHVGYILAEGGQAAVVEPCDLAGGVTAWKKLGLSTENTEAAVS